MSSDVDFNFDAAGVIAVREDSEPPEVIGEAFHLSIRYSDSASVLFRLSHSINSASPDTTVYLQIRVDCIESLERTIHDNAHNSTPSPSCFEAVRQRLNGIQSITRLKFKLCGGSNAQLIVPFDFTIGKLSEESVWNTHGSPRSLAAASLFSLYFRHDILTKKKFKKYNWAIGQFPCLPETKKQRYEYMADVDRLYIGARGKVLKDNGGISTPAREHCTSPTPATPLSCGSTVPFDTGSRRGSPPPYVAAIFAGSPCGDHDPPQYGCTERLHNALDPAEGVLSYGNEDTNAHLAPKRKRTSASGHTTRPSSAEALRPGKLQRSLSADSDDLGRVMCLLERQQRQIDQLQQSLGESRRENEALKRRCDDLEGRWSELEHCKDDIVGNIDNLDVEVDELQARCDTLEKQMPDICDDMEERKGQIVEEFRKKMGESIEDAIEAFEDVIAKRVDAKVNQVKRKICKALQST
ncbi:hypothetical protein LX32DRAFT_645837 [Colletotrichum zoysiae]|uniref:Uncharacterized protein n=1 Tax=Colletotrichum zoysiae TaxID=1216348 RepID=A0AAD9H4R9_9PEZI|nr:hypothetical protein LX32DRAFT_645837 [Colletotrichum zoysiae]